MPPKVAASEAARAYAQGFRTHKLKARPDTIVEMARLMTEATGPDYRIRVDPNTTFGSYHTAVRLARELLPYNVEVYEDPFPVEDTSLYRQFRAKAEPPVARHLGSEREAYRWLKAEAMDAFNCGGNVAQMRKLDALAQAAGVPMWGQMFAFGSCIASTFAVHIACTLPALTMAVDELPHIRVDDLSGGSFPLTEGAVTVPDAPGLGVTLDRDAVEHYRVR